MDEDEKALLFADVKFIIAQCHRIDEIKKILIDGGAKHINYLSEHVTLVIADINCPEAEEAVDLYDKPVVNSLWVYLSLKAKKLLPTEAFSPIKNIFNNVVASISSKLSRRDSDILVATLTYHGARVSKYVSNSTHFIVTATNDLENLPDNAPTELKIVAPDWVLESVKLNNCCDEQLFDPSLLLPPPPPTPSPPPQPPKQPTPPPPQVVIKEKESPITPNIIANQLKKPTFNNQQQKSIISLPKSRPQDGSIQQQQQLNHQQHQQQYYQRQYPQQNFYQNPQQGQGSQIPRPPISQSTHVVQTGPVQVANTRQQFRPNLVANTTPQQVRPARNIFYNQQQKPTHVHPQHPQDSLSNQQQYHIQQQPQQPPTSQQQQYYQRQPSQQNFRPTSPQIQTTHVQQPLIQSTHQVQTGPVQAVSNRPQYQANLIAPAPGAPQIRGPRTFYNPQQRPRAPVPQHSQDPMPNNNQQYHTQQQQAAQQQQQYYPRQQYPQQNFTQTPMPPTNQQVQQSTSHPAIIQGNTNQMSNNPPLTVRPQFQPNLSTGTSGPQQVRANRNLFYNQNHDHNTPQGNIRITNPSQVIHQTQSPRIPNSSNIVSNQTQNQPQTQSPKPHPSIFDHTQESNLALIRAKVPIVNENIEYFGHDPKENVPKNLPFIGCRFGLIDYEEVDMKKKERWRETIKTAGGLFEEDLKNMTHLICENRESELFQEASKLDVRCITIYWINDILSQNRLTYPWKALHLPVAFPKNKKPLTSDNLIAVTNIKGKSRREIRDMIQMTGARYTEHFSARNFLIICGNVGGDKYEHAVEWKTPIANCQLISDLLLNSDKDINLMLTQSKYQLFNTSEHLKLNSYSEIRELMKPWKKPIAIVGHKSMINGDMGRSLQPTNNSEDSGIATTDDNNCTNVEIKNNSEEQQKNERSLRKSIEPVRLLFTHLNSNLVEKLKSYAMELGLSFADSPINCTHLIVDRISRTPKFVCAFSHAKYILDYKWIIESHEANDLLDEKHFVLQDKAGEEKYLFNLVYSWLKRKKRNGLLFSNFIFFVTPSVISEVSNVKEMIESAGGVVSTKKAPSKMQLDQIKSDGKRLVVVSCDKDQYLCSTLEPLEVDIVDVEFVITGILRQDIDFESHRLKKTQLSFVRPDTNTSLAQISTSPTKKMRLEESSC